MNDYMQALHAWFCREPDRPELERGASAAGSGESDAVSCPDGRRIVDPCADSDRRRVRRAVPAEKEPEELCGGAGSSGRIGRCAGGPAGDGGESSAEGASAPGDGGGVPHVPSAMVPATVPPLRRILDFFVSAVRRALGGAETTRSEDGGENTGKTGGKTGKKYSGFRGSSTGSSRIRDPGETAG